MWFYCFNCALFSSKYAANCLFFLILCTIRTDDAFNFNFILPKVNTDYIRQAEVTLEVTLDIIKAMWLAMWHTTRVCFITSFNRICYCRYFVVTWWKNWSKNKRQSSEMLLRMKKFNIKAKVSYISIFIFCACAIVSGISQTHVTQKCK